MAHWSFWIRNRQAFIGHWRQVNFIWEVTASTSSFMDRKSCMRREGTPAWMQAVERRLEQAADDARSRPTQAGIQWFKPAIPARHKRAGVTTRAARASCLPAGRKQAVYCRLSRAGEQAFNRPFAT